MRLRISSGKTLGRVSEQLGFDSLWVGEHVVMFDDHKSDYPLTGEVMPGDPRDNIEIDLFTSLAFLAAVTSRIRLGSYVACLASTQSGLYRQRG